jgi:hypothetical protein
MKKFGSHCTDCREMLYFCIFRKSAEKIQVSLKSDNTVRDNSSLDSSEVENITDKVVKKIKTHFIFNKSCNFSGNVEK